MAWLFDQALLASLAVLLVGQDPHQHHPPATPPASPPPQHEGHTAKPKTEPQAKPRMRHEDHATMRGVLGDWPMAMEAGGTTWQPTASPHFAKPIGTWGPYDIHLMGIASLGYVDAGGKRGDEDLSSNSMAILQARRETAGGILSLRAMFSADALIHGEKGVPNLLQTGETANGQPLVDRQHPHDLFAELAASYSFPVGGDRRAFLYVGLPGEPALGNSVFLHRASGMENPEAPISHHWFDSTHISFGVVTAGLSWGERWKLDASAFNGREPDENRYDIELEPIDSASVRLTHNTDDRLSFTAAYGFLKQPEALEPGENQHRITASATHIQPMRDGRSLATSLMFGRNVKDEDSTDTWNLESTLYAGRDAYFLRLERAEKDEIVGVPAGRHTIHKLVLGGVRNVATRDGFDWGVGAYAGFSAFQSELEPFYGKRPVTMGIFIRARPSAHGEPAMQRH